MDWSFGGTLFDCHAFVLQAQPLQLTDLVQQVDALRVQVDSLQKTNQLLSDGLTGQIEFLKQENRSITDSFSKYIDAMKWNLTALTGLAAVLSIAGGWIFKRSLEDAKETAGRIVREELSNHIQPLVSAEADNLRKTLQTEQIIGRTVVDYYVPNTANNTTTEYSLLNSRGFSNVRLWRKNRKPEGRFGSVLVIDFVNCDLLVLSGLSSDDKAVQRAAQQQRDHILNNTVQELITLRLGNPIVIIYVRPGSGRLESIDKLTTTFPELKYYASANTPVSLMGAVVDSAYVAYGDR